MDIVTELEAFDGKHTDILETLVARPQPKTSLIQELCTVAENDEAKLQVAATWLLKRFQENGVSFPPAQVEDCLELLNKITDWEAKMQVEEQG